MKGESGFQRRKAGIAPFIYGLGQVVKNVLCAGFGGALGDLQHYLLKLRLDSRAGNFSLFCRSRGRGNQRRCGRGQLRGVAGPAIYGGAAGSSECDKHAGAMGGDHGEWRRLPSEVGYPATGNDSTYCNQRDWGRRGRSSSDQNTGADLPQGFAMADAGRDVAFLPSANA
jgi:hypothetical protein